MNTPAPALLTPVLLSDFMFLKKIAFAIFATVFLVILVRVLLAPKDRMARQASIPLSDDTVIEPREEDPTHG